MSNSRGRILHVITNLQLGGAQVSTARICCALQKRGWEVHLAFSSEGGNYHGAKPAPVLIDQLHQSGVTLHDLIMMRHDTSALRDLRAVIHLCRLMRRIRPDVIHTHTSKAGALGRLAGWIMRIPAVHSVRGWSFYSTDSLYRRRVFILVERFLAKRTDTLMAVGNSLIEQGLHLGIGNREKYTIVRSGFSLSSASVSAKTGIAFLPSSALVVAGIMELREHKAPMDFLKIANLVIRSVPNVHFLLIGDGPLGPDLRAYVGQLRLTSRFHLLGLRNDVNELMNGIDVHILTSLYEGLPRVVVETMAAGIPNVASALPGTKELISDGNNGYLVSARDIETFALRIEYLLRNKGVRIKMGESAREKITDEFTWDYVFNRYDAIYRNLLVS